MYLHRIGAFVVLMALGYALTAAAAQEREINVDAINLPEGYAVEAAITGLSLPTTLIFDGADMLIAESGYKDTAQPRVLRIRPDGTVTQVAHDGLQSPVTGLLVHEGTVYVSHRTKVSKVRPDGTLEDIVTDLPSLGDHQNNQLVWKDGRIYLSQGTATNAGIVGVDNEALGWLTEHPDFHDVPCRDITLSGANVQSFDPRTDNPADQVTTGAYLPFGTPSSPGQVITGEAKCNGAVLSFLPDGSDLRMVAWGLRNPFGLEVAPNGDLWATYHGADVRGSRSIYNDADYFVRIRDGAWYGWPDFFKGQPVTDASFDAPGADAPRPVFQQHPPLTKPDVLFDEHAGANGFAFSPGGTFGFAGDAFIAMFGAYAPATTGPNVKPAGFSVVRVDAQGNATDFMTNDVPGPDYLNRRGGLNRPSDVAFGPDGAMYVADWGSAKLGDKGLELQPETGIIWRVWKSDAQQAAYGTGPVIVPAAPTPEEEHQALAGYSRGLVEMVARGVWPYVSAILVIGVLFAIYLWVHRVTRR